MKTEDGDKDAEASVETPKKKIRLDESENNEPTTQDKPKVSLATATATSASKILNQIEYYFSDVNIVNDKFMLAEISNNSGWISIATLLTFARLKQLVQDTEGVINAIKSNESDLIELDEEKKRIKRKKPIPESLDAFKKELDDRTVHLSGFPTDYTYEDLRNFCLKYGAVDAVMMRQRYKTKEFKGNIHVVFKQKADADKVMAMDNFVCKDRELRRESMQNYRKRKEEFSKSYHQKKKTTNKAK